MKNAIIGVMGLLVSVFNTHGFHISSPNGRITIDVTTDSDSSVLWSAYHDGNCICAPAPIGIEIDGKKLGNNVELTEVLNKRNHDTYTLISSHSPIETEWQEMTLENVAGVNKFFIDVRCYDSGLAYRLRVPGKGVRRVNGETAVFRLPKESTVWFGERNSNWKLKTYAGEFTNAPAINLHKVSQQGPVQTMPLLYQLSDSLYIMIAEAALYNYSGMRLKALPTGELVSDFTEDNGFEVNDDITTPWRVLIIAENLTNLTNNHLLYDLSPSPDTSVFKNYAWIKPGRSVWSWWSNIDGKYMSKTAEYDMIDFAHSLGFEYTTIDEGWEDVDDKWSFVNDIVEYGTEKGIGVILWRHSNRLDNPDNDYREMSEFMDTVAALGVKGLKIDFMNGEDKKIIDFTTRALQLAAQRELVINFHGCQKPSGEIRTYPNELTREAVRGLELNRITVEHYKSLAGKECELNDTSHIVGGENQFIPPGHNVLLPLTRCVLGPADYTPIGFSNPGNTTWSHQLASAYVISSPLTTMAENPFYLFREKKLKPVLPFIKTLPVVWDETIILNETQLGESIFMARRSGEDWYVIGLSVNPSTTTICLDFLNDTKYMGEWIGDDTIAPRSIVYGNSVFSKNDMFEINTQRGGGFVLKLKPVA